MRDIKYQDIAESISSIKYRHLNENLLVKAALPVAGAVGAKLVGDKLEDEGIVPRGVTGTLALGTLGVIGAEALKKTLKRSSLVPMGLKYSDLLRPIT